MVTRDELSNLVRPLTGSLHDDDSLIEEIGDRRLVLIG